MKSPIVALVLTLGFLSGSARATTLGAIVTKRGVAIAIDSRETTIDGKISSDNGIKLEMIDETVVAGAGVISWAREGTIFSVARAAFADRTNLADRVQAFKAILPGAISGSAAILDQATPESYRSYLAGTPVLYVILAGVISDEAVMVLVTVNLKEINGQKVITCSSRTVTKDESNGLGGCVLIGTPHAKAIIDKEGLFWNRYGMLEGVIRFVRRGVSGSDQMSGGSIDSLVLTSSGYRWINRKGREGRFTPVASR